MYQKGDILKLSGI